MIAIILGMAESQYDYTFNVHWPDEVKDQEMVRVFKMPEKDAEAVISEVRGEIEQRMIRAIRLQQTGAKLLEMIKQKNERLTVDVDEKVVM